MFKFPPKKLGGKRQTKSLDKMVERPDPLRGHLPDGRDLGGGGGGGGSYRVGNGHNQASGKYRRRTADDFLLFCQFILDYTKYDQMKQQELRRRHSSSPSLGSTGSGNESLPRSSTSGGNDLDDVDDVDSDDVVDRRKTSTSSSSKRMSLISTDSTRRGPNRKTGQYNNDFADGGRVGTKAAKGSVDDDEDEEVDDDDDDEVDEKAHEQGEDWNQVTCYCRRPFAGRPMIECSRCLTWVHLKCAKLTRQRIPDTWFCQKCKTAKSEKSDESSTRRHSGNKKSSTALPSPKASSTAATTAVATPTSEKVSGSRKRKSTSRRQKLASPEDDLADVSSIKQRRLVDDSGPRIEA